VANDELHHFVDQFSFAGEGQHGWAEEPEFDDAAVEAVNASVRYSPTSEHGINLGAAIKKAVDLQKKDRELARQRWMQSQASHQAANLPTGSAGGAGPFQALPGHKPTVLFNPITDVHSYNATYTPEDLEAYRKLKLADWREIQGRREAQERAVERDDPGYFQRRADARKAGREAVVQGGVYIEARYVPPLQRHSRTELLTGRPDESHLPWGAFKGMPRSHPIPRCYQELHAANLRAREDDLAMAQLMEAQQYQKATVNIAEVERAYQRRWLR
jgi:hypothetical protein